MSLNMYLGSTDTQTMSMNQFCIQTIQGMEEAMASIDQFLLNMLLQGETYRTAKEYMAQTFRPLAQGIIYLCEELIRQNDKYPSDFRAQVSGSDVIEQDILDQIEQIERLISRFTAISKITPTVTVSIQIYEEMKRLLEQKLEDLYEFNATSSTNYQTAMELAENVAQGLTQVQGGKGFNPDTGIFSTKGMELGWVKKLDDIHYTRKAKEHYPDYLEQHPDDLDDVITILKYEETNPTYVKQTNEFLSPLEVEDIVGIKYLMYTADEPYRTLAMKYLDRFEIISTTKSGRFYPSDDAVGFNIAEDREDPRGEYYTFFHEIGHAIDYYYGVDNRENSLDGIKEVFGNYSYFSDNFEVDGKSLNDHIYQDTENNFRTELKKELQSQEYNHLSIEEKKEMTDNVTENLMNQNRNHKSLTESEKTLQAYLENMYELKLEGPDHNTASDIYSGVTNKTIEGSYSHEKDYWFNYFGKRIREPNREAFAEYYGRIMVASDMERDEGLESIEEFLPEARQHMNKIFEVLDQG